MTWILGMPIALSLAGCEPVRDFSSRIPGIESNLTEQSKPSVQAQSADIGQMEAEIAQQINNIRQENDLNVLENNERLAQVARNYSRTMAQENFFSHTSPDGSTPAQRVRNAQIVFSAVGENLFQSTNLPNPVERSVEGWMNSPGHRENILRSVYTETGVGIWRDGNTYYITQLFMRPLV
ncbi:MAG TPA: CAP domain-containing protein [Coleofasciculaceae cyanobacterium]